MGIKVKKKGFRKKLTRIEKERKKLGRKLAVENGKAFLLEALDRTQVADGMTSATYGEGGVVIHHEIPVQTPNFGYSISGWKKAARRLRVPFFAPHEGGFQQGSATIKQVKGDSLIRATLINETSFIGILDGGGTMPAFPPINSPHGIEAGNILGGGIRAATRAAKRNHKAVTAKRLRKAFRTGK
jgi:hypothetical protein